LLSLLSDVLDPPSDPDVVRARLRLALLTAHDIDDVGFDDPDG
jgi:hypothetical protein